MHFMNTPILPSVQGNIIKHLTIGEGTPRKLSRIVSQTSAFRCELCSLKAHQLCRSQTKKARILNIFSRKNTDSHTSWGCPRENGRKVYGGVPKKEQLPAVRAGAPILVATPGRLNDFLECLRKGKVCWFWMFFFFNYFFFKCHFFFWGWMIIVFVFWTTEST